MKIVEHRSGDGFRPRCQARWPEHGRPVFGTRRRVPQRKEGRGARRPASRAPRLWNTADCACAGIEIQLNTMAELPAMPKPSDFEIDQNAWLDFQNDDRSSAGYAKVSAYYTALAAWKDVALAISKNKDLEGRPDAHRSFPRATPNSGLGARGRCPRTRPPSRERAGVISRGGMGRCSPVARSSRRVSFEQQAALGGVHPKRLHRKVAQRAIASSITLPPLARPALPRRALLLLATNSCLIGPSHHWPS